MAGAVSGGYLALPARGERVRLEAAGDGELALVRLADGERRGTVRLTASGDWLLVEELCVDEAARGYGLGSEAGRLLREGAAAAGWRRLRAWAPPDRGLAVYFWIRMGLHPLHGPGPEGGIWLEHSLA